MNKKLDLDEYLNRYQNDQYKRKTNDSRILQKTKSNMSLQKPRADTCQQNHRFFHSKMQVDEQQPLDSQFNRSQGECLEFLRSIRRRLTQKELHMSSFFQCFLRQREEAYLLEHNRLKTYAINKIEQVFEQNQRKMIDLLRTQAEPQHFLDIREQIAVMDRRIQELQTVLSSSCDYKRGIAQIVTADFEGQVRSIHSLIKRAEEDIINKTGKVIVDEERLRRICAEMEELLAVAEDRRVLKERPDMVQSRQTVNGRSRVKFMDGNTYSTFSGNQPSQAPFVNPQRVEQSSTQSGRFFNFS